MPSPDDIVPLNAPPRVTPPLFPGDPAPWFRLPSDLGAPFMFPAMGGRMILLTFLPSFSEPESAAILAGLLAGAERFRPFSTAMLIVSADPNDRGARLPETITGVRYLFDDAGLAASLFGLRVDGKTRPTTFLIGGRLQILAVAPVRDASTHAAEAFSLFDRDRKSVV